MALSFRAEAALKNRYFMNVSGAKLEANPYDKERNPEGIINLGLAENLLITDIVNERLNRADALHVEPWQHFYPPKSGIWSFREVLAKFIDRYFKPAAPIKPEHVIVTNGVAGAVEDCAFAFADPGDCFLIPVPVYPMFEADIGDRVNVKTFYFSLSDESDSPEGRPFQISHQALEDAYNNATAQGEKVKGVLVVNPVNPTGTMFTRRTLETLVEFTERHDIHLIVDEIFAMTVHGQDSEFVSILTIPRVMESDRVHMTWGISKDFGLSGFRQGLLWSRHDRLQLAIEFPCFMGIVSSPTQMTMAKVLADYDWLDTVYFPTSRSRIRRIYDFVVEGLKARGIVPHPAEATFFIWANIKKYVTTADEEMEMFERFFQAGVYMIPGLEFHASEPGWFRVTITTHLEYWHLAFERIDGVLDAWKR